MFATSFLQLDFYHIQLTRVSFYLDDNLTVANLRQFVRRQSAVKITLPDCLHQFDEYAAKFVKALTSSAEEGDSIVNDARNEALNLDNEHVCH